MRSLSPSSPGYIGQDAPTAGAVFSETVRTLTSHFVALLMIVLYLAAAILVGYLVRHRSGTTMRFLHARSALPTVVTSLAFLASNCGALEVVGIVAASAKYGAMALHFYWIGAIPAMVFLALFMMPVYLRSGAITVPDFIRIRYNAATHVLSAVMLAFLMILVAGISLFAISSILHLFFGWRFSLVALGAAIVVLFYTLTGGLRATIYNEILQLGLTVAGLVPLAWAVYARYGGVAGILRRLPASKAHIWTGMPLLHPKGAALDVFGVVFGLGAVLSFSYWCTDFVLIQRALAARTREGAIRTPLLAATLKLAVPWLLIFPGMSASFLWAGAPHRSDYALPLLIQQYYGPALIGLGVSAILASLMSGLAANVSAFSALCTHDLYRMYMQPHKDDGHYLLLGRGTTVVAAALSIGTAYIVFYFNNLMDYLQLVLSLFSAPMFAVFLLGMFTVWATPPAAFCGLLCGVLAACGHAIAVRLGILTYGSPLLGDFYGAALAWTTTAAITVLLSLLWPARSDLSRRISSCVQQKAARIPISRTAWFLAGAVLTACMVLNILYR